MIGAAAAFSGTGAGHATAGVGVAAGAGVETGALTLVGAFGTLVQAASAAAASASAVRTPLGVGEADPWTGEQRMGWLAFELALGLALFIGIVWWTFPRRSRNRSKPPPEE